MVVHSGDVAFPAIERAPALTRFRSLIAHTLVHLPTSIAGGPKSDPCTGAPLPQQTVAGVDTVRRSRPLHRRRDISCGDHLTTAGRDPPPRLAPAGQQ